MERILLLGSLVVLDCGLLVLSSEAGPGTVALRALPEDLRTAESLTVELREPALLPTRTQLAARPPREVIPKTIVVVEVFDPSTLPVLRSHGLTVEAEAQINSYLDHLKGGGGLAYIRAPKKLAAMGAKMLPVAVTRLMSLDFNKALDNQFAYAISEAVELLTDFELAFDPARILAEFELATGDANAKKVRALHRMVSTRWVDDTALKHDKVYRADRFADQPWWD